MTTLRLALPFGKYLRAHHFSRAGFVAAGILAALLFFFIGAFLRLLLGPVSIGPFSGTLQAAIDQALPGVTVKYDQAAVEWSREEQRVTLAVLGARVFDADGRIIAQAPKADIDLAAAPLFLHGQVQVRQITLVGVELTLVHTRAGGLRLGVEKDTGETDFLDNLTDTLTATNTSNSSLQRFAVRDARMAFFDEFTGLFIVAPRADLKIETAGQNLEATLDADIEISGKPARITASLTLPPKKGPVNGALAVSGLDVSALGTNTKSFAALKTVALKSDFTTSFRIDEGSHLAAADFGIDARGTVRFPGLIDKPFPIRAMHLLGRYDGTSNRLLIEDGQLDSPNAGAHLNGRVDFSYDINNELTRVDWDAVMDKIHFADPTVLAVPLELDRIGFRGNFAIATNDLVIDHLGMSGGPLSLDLAGKVTLVNGQSPAIAVSGKTAALSVRDMLKYWPLTVGGGARDWIAANISAGSVGPIVFETHLPAGALDQPALPDGALLMTFPLSGVEANYIQGLTHLTQVTGNAKLTGDNFEATFASARIGPLVVSKGHATISNLHLPGPPGAITAHIAGSMPDILALIDKKPLNYPTRFGIDVQGTKGQASVDLSVRLPMLKNLSVNDVAIGVKSDVTDFDIALGRTRLTDGTVNFAVDNDKLVADGTVTLAGSRLAVNWREDFKGNNPITTQVTAKGALGEAAREALNLHTGDFLTGPISVNATLTGRRGQFSHADMTADLTEAALLGDLLGIHKPPGVPATARVAVDFDKGTVVKQADVHIAGPETTIVATAGFTPSGSLATLNMPVVKVGAVDDFSLTYARGPTGVDITVRGRSIDGSNIASRGSNGATGSASTESTFDGPFHIDAKVDRLELRDGVAVAPFALEVSGIGSRPSALSLSGSMSKSAQVSGSIVQGASGRRVSFATNDLALLVHGLFGFTSMRGGSVEFAAMLPGRAGDPDVKSAVPDYQGTIAVKDVTLTNQPFLARLFTAASIVGVANLFGGQGIAIDKAEIPFSSKNGVISIHDAYASGPTIGATADGYIDRPKDAIAIKGSLAPAVGLNINSVIGAIPLVGNLLVSKKGEGIIGVTYSLRGDADQPTVSVNPLAILTPGILRRIFQGRMPTAEQAPSNNPPPAAPPAVLSAPPPSAAPPPKTP